MPRGVHYEITAWQQRFYDRFAETNGITGPDKSDKLREALKKDPELLKKFKLGIQQLNLEIKKEFGGYFVKAGITKEEVAAIHRNYKATQTQKGNLAFRNRSRVQGESVLGKLGLGLLFWSIFSTLSEAASTMKSIADPTPEQARAINKLLNLADNIDAKRQRTGLLDKNLLDLFEETLIEYLRSIGVKDSARALAFRLMQDRRAHSGSL